MATKKATKPVRKAAPKPKPKAKARAPKTAMDEMIEVMDDGEGEEIVPASALATYQDKPAMDASDLFIPKLRLAQGLTSEVQNGEAKPGQWLVLGYDPMAEVDVIPVGMARRRELRDPDVRAVVCRSGDSITGLGNPGGDCATCPMNQWTQSKKKNGKNEPPQCSFIYSYMVYVVNTQSMAILEFYRTSITTGKMMNTMISQRGLGTFAVKLGSVSKQGPKGTFYNPSISASKVKPEELKRAAAEATYVR